MLKLDLTLLRAWVLLGAHGLARPLAGTRVRVGALTAHWKTAAMAGCAVAVDAKQTLHVHLLLTTKITFDDDLQRLRSLGDQGKLLVGEFPSASIGINVGVSQNLAAHGKTDAVNVRQGVFDLLFVGDFDSE